MNYDGTTWSVGYLAENLSGKQISSRGNLHD